MSGGRREMTRAEIVAWSEDAGRKLTSDRLSATPLSKTQRARVKELRWEAAEKMRREQNRTSASPRSGRVRQAAYGD